MRTFELFLIKPSHYDDDGYVIQWKRSSIPSNSLAALYGLALECKDRCTAPSTSEGTVLQLFTATRGAEPEAKRLLRRRTIPVRAA